MLKVLTLLLIFKLVTSPKAMVLKCVKIHLWRSILNISHHLPWAVQSASSPLFNPLSHTGPLSTRGQGVRQRPLGGHFFTGHFAVKVMAPFDKEERGRLGRCRV